MTSSERKALEAEAKEIRSQIEAINGMTGLAKFAAQPSLVYLLEKEKSILNQLQ